MNTLLNPMVLLFASLSLCACDINVDDGGDDSGADTGDDDDDDDDDTGDDDDDDSDDTDGDDGDDDDDDDGDDTDGGSDGGDDGAPSEVEWVCTCEAECDGDFLLTEEFVCSDEDTIEDAVDLAVLECEVVAERECVRYFCGCECESEGDACG